MSSDGGEVLVPLSRLLRWVENFTARHGESEMSVAGGAFHGTGADGSSFAAHPPFAASYAGTAELAHFLESCTAPPVWGVLLVRKGGFAMARLERGQQVESKTGQRHVQGRTKAGGQSQQRFARRRDNQARAAYEAAADHAARILGSVPLLVTGGDRVAVEAVLTDRRLARATVVPPFLTVPDPRRSVLDQAVLDAQSVRVEVSNA